MFSDEDHWSKKGADFPAVSVDDWRNPWGYTIASFGTIGIGTVIFGICCAIKRMADACKRMIITKRNQYELPVNHRQGAAPRENIYETVIED